MKNKEEILRELVEIMNDKGLTEEKREQREKLLFLDVLLDLRDGLKTPKSSKKE